MKAGTIAVVALWAAACAPVDTGNGGGPDPTAPAPELAEVKLALVAAATTPSGAPALADREGVVFGLEGAFAQVSALELRPVGVDEQVEDVEVSGPWTVDLLTGAFTPPLYAEDLPAGTYDRFEVLLAPASSSELGGASVLLEATTSGGEGDPMSVSLRLEFEEELAFETSVQISLEEGMVAPHLTLDATRWFEDVALAACAEQLGVPSDGPIVVEDGEGACEGIEGDIAQALSESAGEAEAETEPHESDHAEEESSEPNR